MAEEVLDNPIWHALGGPHRHLGIDAHGVRRYQPEVSIFISNARPTEGIETFPMVLQPGELAGLAATGPLAMPAGMTLVREADVLQMIASDPRPAAPAQEAVDLGLADVPAMIELTKLTQPGPFAPRTREMGRYIGIKVDGTLVAMAGERMHLDGLTEISAVCTHPDHRGKGYAKGLMSVLMGDIARRGETAFLHSYADNAVAIAAYRALGFTDRREMVFTVMQRT